MSTALPDPARLAALEVVVRTLAGHYLAPTLRAVLDAGDLEGAQRSQVTDLAYGALRRLQQLDAHLAPRLKRPEKLPPRVLGALRLGVLDLLYRSTPAHAAVSEWVEVVKREARGLAPLANAVLRGVERAAARDAAAQGDGAPKLDPVRDLSLPPWLWERFEDALGSEDAAAAAFGMLEPEPLWLTAFGEAAKPALEADGCEVGELLPGDPFPASLRVRAGRPLDRLTAYRDGLVQPQNPASLQAALALVSASASTARTRAMEPGTVCFDLASGRGVKSAALAAAGAEVTAVELSKRRIRAATTNLERLGQTVVHVAADLVTTSAPDLLDAIAAANGWPEPRTAQAVLLDAPCSGTGTLRGHPEIKLRLTPADVAALAATQRAMLTTAAEFVAPGGALVYAVCALTREEGPDVVESFLAAEPRFAPELITTELPSAAATPVGRYLLPIDGFDGFYLARLRHTAR